MKSKEIKLDKQLLYKCEKKINAKDINIIGTASLKDIIRFFNGTIY
ncbi:hypothetical protein KPL35_04525 [Clostridium sp. CF011]|nr:MULTISPECIES: hypothetical protein [unclassified Clostridium]MBU3091334.1 hypothetical protein [Clostridium sp. CF011]